MNIQSNINQMFSIAGALTMMSPAYKEKAGIKADIAELKRKDYKLGEQAKAIGKKAEGIRAQLALDPESADIEGGVKAATHFVEIAEKASNVSRELFDLDPSLKNYERMVGREELVEKAKDKVQKITENAERIRIKRELAKQRALEETVAAQEERRQGRPSFSTEFKGGNI